MEDLKPIPETARAINELDHEDDELLEQLLRTGHQVRSIVPDVVGLSISMIDHGVTLTLVASETDIAVLDAVQYLAGGPCVQAVEDDEMQTHDQSSLDENQWHVFADATRAHGVHSTLSMPVIDRGTVVGGVNVYAATRKAFEGNEEALAGVLGAWAAGAVSNADLSFETRKAAQQAPDVLREAARVDVAVGLLAARLDLDVEESRDRIQRASARAGVTQVRLAEMLRVLLDHDER
ncbi:MAG: hypothetical protein JWN84_3919 [Nocardioides sp.]|nr:hypothetical protein [Nocardioides sp.]